MSDIRLYKSRFKGTKAIRSIPDPGDDIESLRETVIALKEIVEVLSRQRGDVGDSAVTVNDLYENSDLL